MHPIERLRYVARASGAPHDLLARETASALAAFGGDPSGMVTACRRIVARQSASGPVWWMAARVLTAPDPLQAAWAAVEELQSDPTGRELSHALPEASTVCVLGWPEVVSEALLARGDSRVLVVDVLGEGAGLVRRLELAGVQARSVEPSGLGGAVVGAELVLLEASALGGEEFLGVAGSRAAAATARHAGVPVWLVAGRGRLLPLPMWGALRSRLGSCEPWAAEDEAVPLELVDLLAGPCGPEPVADGLGRLDCPLAPELLKGL